MPLESEFVDWELDANDNLIIPIRHISGRKGVAQRIRIALLMIRGEWFRDLDKGMPYFNGPGIDPTIVLLGNKFFDKDLAEAQFRDAISRVPGVGRIDALTLSLDGATRKLAVTWRITPTFDDAPIEDTTEVDA